MYNTFTTNDFIEAILYDKNKIKSYFKYRILLHRIKKTSPDYNTLNIIYEFIDQMNYAYFYCLDNDNKLFIKNSRKRNSNTNRALLYKDTNITISITLKPDEVITLDVDRRMGYPNTSITFKNGQAINYITNPLEEQFFINCINLLMNELYRIIKKYRKFGRIK